MAFHTSAVIKTSLKQNPDSTENDIQMLAKKCLLNVSDTHYLVEHHRAIEKRKELKKAMKAKSQETVERVVSKNEVEHRY